MGVAVGGVEGVLGEQFAAREGVGEEPVRAAVQHPHRLPVRPDAARIAVARGERELALLDTLPVRQAVGEEPLAAAVRDPDGLAVGPEAAGRAIRLGQLELALAEAFAAGAVVGVDLVVGALAVLGDPEGLAVGPETRGPVVAAVQRLDVALHGPLEVDLARAGTAGTAATTAAAAGDDDDGREHRPGGDRDGHLDCRRGVGLATAVVGGDRHHIRRLRGDIEGDPSGHRDLAVTVDVEGGRVGAGEAVRERVVLVDVRGRHGRADIGASLRAFGHGASARL